MKKSFAAACLFALIIASCKKADTGGGSVTPPPPVSTGTYQQLLADSLFLYAKQIYYWNTSLPDSASFNPRSYAQTDTLTGLQNELFAITQIPINSATGKPYEFYQYVNTQGSTVTTSKYSFIEKTSDLYGGGSASTIISNQEQVKNIKMTLDGQENELGFTMGFMYASGLNGTSRAIPYTKDSIIGLIRVVTNGSPAWNAGIRRGDIIAKINGNAWTYNNNFNQIENAIDGNNITLTRYDPVTKKNTDIPFSKSLYTFNPVYKDTMITIGSKKIAYIAYKSFTDTVNSLPVLSAAFQKFQGATDLVVDLRYNGGGYVNTAEYFAEFLLPQSAANGVLFKEIYNQTMQNKQATLLKKQPVYNSNNIKQNYTYYDIDYSVNGNTTNIRKQGSFNAAGTITKIYFIVSGNTASASELLINSLKPYFNTVYLINAPFSSADDKTHTYGKPVGFFEIRIGKYSIYMSNFETQNKNSEGGYYQGMTTDTFVYDDIRYDLGDPHENCFLQAIRQITGNSTYQPISASPRNLSGISMTTTSNNNLPGFPVGAPTKIFNMVRAAK